MKIALFFPYGMQQPAAPAAQVLGAAAQHCGASVQTLSCNGVFTLCDRDKQTDWKRNARSCFECSCAQQYVNNWGSFSSCELSQYLDARFFAESRLWIHELSRKELPEATIDNVPVGSMVTQVFQERFQKKSGQKLSAREEHVYRLLLLNALRTYQSVKLFMEDQQVDILLLGGAEHYINQAASLAGTALNRSSVAMTIDTSSGLVLLRDSKQPEPHLAPIAVEQLSLLRRDAGSWPVDFYKQYAAVLEYLGIDPSGATPEKIHSHL